MRIGIIGSGTMGSGLAQLFAQCGHVKYVLWKTTRRVSDSVLLEGVVSQWGKMESKGKISGDDLLQFRSKVNFTDNYNNFSKLDFVVEAVTEDISIKKLVRKEAAQYMSDVAVYATNTSSLSITEIAASSKNPQNVVGLHFFNPAPLMRLTEVVVGVHTSDNVKNFCIDFSVLLGKSPVLVNEAPGFIVNRMLIPMINEAIGILAEGVSSPSDIDLAMVNGANHPIGPLALADLIGNDVCLSIMQVLHDETGDPKYRAHPLLRKMVRAGKLGRKIGVGFFEYK